MERQRPICWRRRRRPSWLTISPAPPKCYVTYLNDHSDSAEIWQRLGLVYYLDNRYAQAAPALQRAVELNPSLWGANLFLGISEYRMAQFVRAQESVQAALKVNPDVPEGHLWMGSILMALGQREAATAELEKVPAASSVAMDADYLLVKGYRNVAEDYYRKIQQSDANSYRAHQLAAESFAWDGKYQNAILEYRKALQLKPDLEGAHRGIAEMYWEQHQFEQATQEYGVELQKFPLDDEAHLRIGEYLLSQGKAGEAVPQLETALQVNKKSWELDRALGQASMTTGDMAKAQSWLSPRHNKIRRTLSATSCSRSVPGRRSIGPGRARAVHFHKVVSGRTELRLTVGSKNASASLDKQPEPRIKFYT